MCYTTGWHHFIWTQVLLNNNLSLFSVLIKQNIKNIKLFFCTPYLSYSQWNTFINNSDINISRHHYAGRKLTIHPLISGNVTLCAFPRLEGGRTPRRHIWCLPIENSMPTTIWKTFVHMIFYYTYNIIILIRYRKEIIIKNKNH